MYFSTFAIVSHDFLCTLIFNVIVIHKLDNLRKEVLLQNLQKYKEHNKKYLTNSFRE